MSYIHGQLVEKREINSNIVLTVILVLLCKLIHLSHNVESFLFVCALRSKKAVVTYLQNQSIKKIRSIIKKAVGGNATQILSPNGLISTLKLANSKLIER